MMNPKAQSDYELYLSKYMKQYGYSREEAEQHKLVQETKKYYEELYQGQLENPHSKFTPSGECK